MFAATTLAVPLATLPAQATPEGDNVVISEVYVRGGNGDGVYRDFVELYNPTSTPIDMNGMTLQYYSAKGTTGAKALPLEGSIAPSAHYLVLGAKDTHTTELDVDTETGFNMGAKSGSVVLFSGDAPAKFSGGDVSTVDNVIDAFGWGDTSNYETTPLTVGTEGSSSYQRDATGTDTDNNSVDFTVAEATPMNSTGSALNPQTDPDTDPVDPEPTPTEEPSTPPATNIIPIAEIQGTGAETPLKGQTVTTEGYVTAVYKDGGFNGFYIQTQGTGGTPEGDASHGIFVYTGSQDKNLQNVEKSQYLRVTGTADEYFNLTQITNATWTVEETPTTHTPPVPVTFDVLPAGDVAREKYEGMLVQIEGDYTITDNYNTNRFGELGLAPGLAPFIQPSQKFNPTVNPSEIAALDQYNKEAAVSVDDGSSFDFTKFNYKNDLIPVPYLNVGDPARVGAQVEFLQPMVLDYRNDTWKIQPTEPINLAGDDDPVNYIDNTDKWIKFVNNERPDAPADLGSDITLATFNVLNYFTTTGEDWGCTQGYKDRKGDFVTANKCDPRGAFHADDLKRQEQKIVAAINELDATVVGLEEIENSDRFEKDRDQALNALVAALNKGAGYEKWASVPSPETVPADADVIRLAFIYQADIVKPVGESKILIGDEYITGTAREPLAQEFERADGSDESFVAVVNHFKSKGSLSKVFPNDEDPYQGNNNRLRTAQAKALRTWVEVEYPNKPIFIIGDLNSYGMEDPILEFTNNGYTDTTTELDSYTYQFSGLVGSLDHILANEAAMALVTGVDIWDINADEPIAFEYSRYNYNVKYLDLYDETAFRSSDHDPIVVGVGLPKKGDILVAEIAEPYYDATAEGIVIPTTEGVEYLVDGEVVTGTVTATAGTSTMVTARAIEGYEIADGVTTSWTISVPLPEQPTCKVMDRPGTLAGATNLFGEATGDRYADVWAVNDDGELHFYKGHNRGIFHAGIVDCDLEVTSLTKVSDVNSDKRADFIGRHADGSMNFYYSTGDGFLRYGYKVGHGWNGMDNIIYAGKLGSSSDEYVIARQVATGDLYRYKISANGMTGTTKIGHGWSGMKHILSVGNIVGSNYADIIGITKDGKMIAYEGVKNSSFKTYGQIGHGWTQFVDAFVPGDLTNDGRLDLIGVRGDGKMFLYANTGRIWFAPAKQIGHGWSAMKIMN